MIHGCAIAAGPNVGGPIATRTFIMTAKLPAPATPAAMPMAAEHNTGRLFHRKQYAVQATIPPSKATAPESGKEPGHSLISKTRRMVRQLVRAAATNVAIQQHHRNPLRFGDLVSAAMNTRKI